MIPRHKAEGWALAAGEVEEDTILEFRANGLGEMLVACVWSRWKAPGQPDLLSSAAVTDEPPPEVAAAGHDRCIIPVKRENVNSLLRPDWLRCTPSLMIVSGRSMSTGSPLERAAGRRRRIR